jgi:hypothetical protein
MGTRRRLQFVYALTAWMLGTLLTLSILDAVAIERFFVATLVGFLVLFELTAPASVEPRWRARLKWLGVLGMVGFGYVVIDRVLEFLPPGVL